MVKPLHHSKEIEQIMSETKSKAEGLTTPEATKRLERDGPNMLETKEQTSPLQILADQFKDFLIMLLIAAALVSIGIGFYEQSVQEMIEAGLILVIVAFIIVVGFYQQYHAEKELEALKNLMTPHATVIRDGEKTKINSKDLVVGDVVFVEAGDKIPADLRIIESIQLMTDESSLTGESTPVEKKKGIFPDKTALAERHNMLFMGSTAVSGNCTALVVAVGMQTELGEIAGQIKDIKEEKTPLQERLGLLGKQIGVGVIILCAIVFVSGIIVDGTPLLEMFMIAIALAVAAVPEGLPGVVTVALATGTRRMVKENVIIRKLPAVETLGSTTVICTDKTGTLTKNEMTIKKIWVGGKEVGVSGQGYGFSGGFDTELTADFIKLLTVGTVCNTSTVDESGKITGDPTQAALVVAAAKASLNQKELKEKFKWVNEIPFTSERKKYTSIHKGAGGEEAYCVGAYDVIVNSCSKILWNGKEEKITPQHLKSLDTANEAFASKAYRVLGLAYRRIEENYIIEEAEEDMVFAGLVAMIDPPRPESKTSVSKCKSAGIRVVMITGDHKLTAKAVAEEVGIYSPGDGVLTGQELEALSDDELEANVEHISVYARVSPIHKLRIVTALQKKGHVVAMTGDGVNDAPALKKSDIGIAMGIAGTDVSKEAADMVLTDDNFASIVRAVEEGRGIYDNIRKFFAYLISGNIGEVAIVFLSSIIPGVPIALTASQILIINLVTDGLPALALGVDPFEPGAMSRKPRPKTEPLHRGLAPFIVWYPLIMIITTMGLFLWVWDPAKQNIFEAQTVAFLSVAFFEMYQALTSRSTRYPALRVGILKNKWLLGAVGLSLAVLLVLVYLPFTIPSTTMSLQELTHVTSLTPGMFLLIALLSSAGFIYLELEKWRTTRQITSMDA